MTRKDYIALAGARYVDEQCNECKEMVSVKYGSPEQAFGRVYCAEHSVFRGGRFIKACEGGK